MKKILVAVLLLASASCGYLVVRTHSFMLGFYDIESMGGKLSDVNVSGEDCLRIDVYVKKARMVTDLFGNRPSGNGSYDELCRKYGDLSYPERSFSSGSNPGAVYDCCCPNSDFMYVEVVSNLDWDTEHPAGSSLNDETWFTAVSAYPYIQSSYEMFGYDPDEWSEFFRFYSGGAGQGA